MKENTRKTYEIRVGLESNCYEPDCPNSPHCIAVVMCYEDKGGWHNSGIVEHGKDPSEAFNKAYNKFLTRQHS